MESKFEELCKDFDRRRPSEPPAKRAFWFEAKWENVPYAKKHINNVMNRK